jgi:N,N'-diacetyllegionaminate synthase
MILSTGMATYGEIEDALGAVAKAGNDRVALLRCASVYPAEPEIMNLRAMATMRDAFGVPVGLSDHTTGIAVAAAAAALGAELVEKHFTLSRELEGPDHPFALEPDELKAMVDGVRDAEAAAEMLTVKRPGYGIKPRDMELVIGRTAKVDIEFDEVVTWEMV